MPRIIRTGSPIPSTSCSNKTLPKLLKKKLKPNLQSIYIALIADSFTVNNLKTIILVFILRDEKKEYILALTKNASIIKKLIIKVSAYYSITRAF